jgi:fatty acid desaturase
MGSLLYHRGRCRSIAGELLLPIILRTKICSVDARAGDRAAHRLRDRSEEEESSLVAARFIFPFFFSFLLLLLLLLASCFCFFFFLLLLLQSLCLFLSVS